MTITVPTTTQIASSLEGAARLIAAVVVAVYVAGEMTGRAVFGLSDWLAKFTRKPLQTIIDAISVRETQPTPTTKDLLKLWGAEILEPEALELEIEAEAKAKAKPVARRKPARARKTAVAA